MLDNARLGLALFSRPEVGRVETERRSPAMSGRCLVGLYIPLGA